MPLTEEQKQKILSRMGTAPSRASSASGLPTSIQAIANQVPQAQPYLKSMGLSGPRQGFPLPPDIIAQQLGVEAAKQQIRSQTPKVSDTMRRDYSRIDAFEGILNDLEQLSDSVRKGPIKGRYAKMGAKITGGGKFPGVEERESENAVTYDELRPGVAAGLYRAVTGDDRISDRDAAQRAMPFVPDLALSKKAFAKRLRLIKRAIQRKRDSIKESSTLSTMQGDSGANFYSLMTGILDEDMDESDD